MTPQELVDHVSTTYEIPVEDLMGRSRRADIVRARHIAMFLLREHTDLSYPQIGMLFHRDHTSVMHAVARIEGARRVNRQLDEILDTVA